VERLREMIRSRGLSVQIEVDGGVDVTNARALTAAGADILVAGTAVFGQGDPEAGARRLLDACR
jgi:ribulose-phosphate 3-epimerase